MILFLWVAAAAATELQCAPDNPVLVEHAVGSVCAGVSCRPLLESDLPVCAATRATEPTPKTYISLPGHVSTTGGTAGVEMVLTVQSLALRHWTLQPLALDVEGVTLTGPRGLAVQRLESGQLMWTGTPSTMTPGPDSQSDWEALAFRDPLQWRVTLPDLPTGVVRPNTVSSQPHAPQQSMVRVRPGTQLGPAVLTSSGTSTHWAVVPGFVDDSGIATLRIGGGLTLVGPYTGDIRAVEAYGGGWSGGVIGGGTSCQAALQESACPLQSFTTFQGPTRLASANDAISVGVSRGNLVLAEATQTPLHPLTVSTALGTFDVAIPAVHATTFSIHPDGTSKLNSDAVIWTQTDSECVAIDVRVDDAGIVVPGHHVVFDAASQSPLPCTFETIDSIDLPRPDIDHWFLTRRACRQYQGGQDR